MRGLKEEAEQKQLDCSRLQDINSDLSSKISSLGGKIAECTAKLQSQLDENHALKYTIQLWENRRKAAIQSGQVTVEDVVADKMKLVTKIKIDNLSFLMVYWLILLVKDYRINSKTC